MIRTERSSFKYVALLEGQCSSSFLPSLSRGGAPHISSAPTQGHPSPGRSAISSLRCGERPCDTLRAHPENAAAPAQYPSAERRYRPKVTSGCPKRSEGGFPVGTRTITAFPCGIQAEPCIPRRTWNGVKHERGAASHTGDSASFVRAGSAEELSLPRRTQPESAHARGRRQPDRG